MKAPIKAEAVTLSQADIKAEQEANSERFYKAKHDLFFCEQVIGMAACAAAMSRSLHMIRGAGEVYPDEMKRLKALSPGFSDWSEMPDEYIHWSLNFAAQRIREVSDTMEAAFMAAERGHAEG